MNGPAQVIPQYNCTFSELERPENYQTCNSRSYFGAEDRDRKKLQWIINQCKEKKVTRWVWIQSSLLMWTACNNEAVLKEASVCFEQMTWGEGALRLKGYSGRSCPSLVGNSLQTGSGCHQKKLPLSSDYLDNLRTWFVLTALLGVTRWSDSIQVILKLCNY